MERLDNIHSAARGFHYWSLALAGLSLILATLDKTQGIDLSLGGFQMPYLQGVIAIYYIVMLFVLMAERLFKMAIPWLSIDKRNSQRPRKPISQQICGGKGAGSRFRSSFVRQPLPFLR